MNAPVLIYLSQYLLLQQLLPVRYQRRGGGVVREVCVVSAYKPLRIEVARHHRLWACA